MNTLSHHCRQLYKFKHQKCTCCFSCFRIFLHRFMFSRFYLEMRVESRLAKKSYLRECFNRISQLVKLNEELLFSNQTNHRCKWWQDIGWGLPLSAAFWESRQSPESLSWLDRRAWEEAEEQRRLWRRFSRLSDGLQRRRKSAHLCYQKILLWADFSLWISGRFHRQVKNRAHDNIHHSSHHKFI